MHLFGVVTMGFSPLSPLALREYLKFDAELRALLRARNSAASCPPVGVNGSAQVVTTPVEPGPRAGIPVHLSPPLV